MSMKRVLKMGLGLIVAVGFLAVLHGCSSGGSSDGSSSDTPVVTLKGATV